MTTFPADVEIGSLVRTARTAGRVTAISGDGETVTLHTSHGPWNLPRKDLLRLAVSCGKALALLDRLAVPGSHDAPVPSAPEARALIERMGRTDELPEDQRHAAWRAIRDELDAWLLARSPEDLIDDVRHALAARFTPRTPSERLQGVFILYEEGRTLFRELALVTGIPFVEINYGVARAHRATPPRVLTGHAYLGAFAAKGPLVIADFCYMGSDKAILRERLQGSPGRYHAWVSWSPKDPAREHGLLVVHESALDLLALPTRKAGTVFNDAGMVGVFDAEAAKEGRLQAWLRRQAEEGARVQGVTDGRGVVVDTDGDGGWEVRALHRDKVAVVIRVALHGDATGEEPILVTAGAAGPAAEARAYSPKERFAAGETIAHPKFGAGRVVSAEAGSMEVAFADSVRKLIHGR